MRILIVKTTSLGDVVHTLPAITDLSHHFPEATIDWVVEGSFQEIPLWHRAVNEVIPVHIRQWRKHWIRSWRSREIPRAMGRLRRDTYDLIIDAQGLFKSALLTGLARGKRHGYDNRSARESFSAGMYHVKHAVARNQHAISRTRQLFALAGGYAVPQGPLSYGLQAIPTTDLPSLPTDYIVCCPGTTWITKEWPEGHWDQLIAALDALEQPVVIPWGNEKEHALAKKLAQGRQHVQVLPKLTLTQLMSILQKATVVVSVDSGLSHMAAASEAPTIGLYGATDANRTGIRGPSATTLSVDWLCAPCLKRKCPYQKKGADGPPCYQTLSPERVLEALQGLAIKRKESCQQSVYA